MDRSIEEEISQLKEQVQWLLDKEEIRKLKLLYCRYSDNGRFEDFAELFAADYRTEIFGPPQADGAMPQPQIFASVKDWIAFARTRREVWSANAAHHIHGGEIEKTGPVSARAIWPSQFEGINGY